LLFNPTTIPFLSHVEAVKKSFKFNTGDFDEGYLYIFNGGPNNGSDKWSGVFLTEFDLYEGTTDRKWHGLMWLSYHLATLRHLQALVAICDQLCLRIGRTRSW